MGKQVSGYNGSLELFYTDSEVERMAPPNTLLLVLRAISYQEGASLLITLELTPFQQIPYLDPILTDPAEKIVASTSIVEPSSSKLLFTIHLRQPAKNPNAGSSIEAKGIYNLVATLSHSDLGEIDRRDLAIKLSSQTE